MIRFDCWFFHRKWVEPKEMQSEGFVPFYYCDFDKSHYVELKLTEHKCDYCKHCVHKEDLDKYARSIAEGPR